MLEKIRIHKKITITKRKWYELNDTKIVNNVLEVFNENTKEWESLKVGKETVKIINS